MNTLKAWTERCGSALDSFVFVSYLTYEHIEGMA